MAALARRAERHYGSPQDVEWAIDPLLPAEARTSCCSRAGRRPSGAARRSASTTLAEDTYSSIVHNLLHPSGTQIRPPALTVPRPAANTGETPWPTVSRARSRSSTPDRRRGMGGAVRLLHGVQRGPARARGLDVLVHGRRAHPRGRSSRGTRPSWTSRSSSCGQYTTRHYVIPPALGVDIRYLNGYMYLSPGRRSPTRRRSSRGSRSSPSAPATTSPTGRRLYDAWMDKIKGVIAELEAIDFQPLPHREDMSVLTEGRGIGSGQLMMIEYDKLVAAHLRSCGRTTSSSSTSATRPTSTSSGSASSSGPRIPDQAIAKMVAGIDVDLFRPDEELKKLAQLAVDLGVGDRIGSDAAATLAAMDADDGRQAVVGGLGGGARPVVQLLVGLGLLPLRQGLGGVPRHPDGLHRVVRREARPR